MKHALQPLVLILLLGVAGCASNGGSGLGYQNINAFTARYMEAWERRMEPQKIQPLNIFSHRDLVAAVVRNYTNQDQLVLVEYLRADNGEAVLKKPITVLARGSATVFAAKPLPAGEYLLKVTPIGMQPFMQAFSVRGL